MTNCSLWALTDADRSPSWPAVILFADAHRHPDEAKPWVTLIHNAASVVVILPDDLSVHYGLRGATMASCGWMKKSQSHKYVFWISFEQNCRTLRSSNHVCVLEISPRHWTCVPLQSPLDIHSRTREPTRVYPVLQEKMAVAPYTVSVPILLPFGGVPRSPQEMTATRKQYVIKKQYS